MILDLGPAEITHWRADASRPPPLLIDVREPWEFDYCRIEGSLSIPLSELAARIGEVPADRPLVMVCHHGHRSFHAAVFLKRAGFAEVHNLRGGVEEWAARVEPGMKRY